MTGHEQQDVFPQLWGELRTAIAGRFPDAQIRTRPHGIALVEADSTAAVDLLSDLVAPDQLWRVSSETALTFGRFVQTPYDRGTVPATLLALTDLLVEDPEAVLILATPKCAVVPKEYLVAAIGEACVEVLRESTRPIIIGEGDAVAVIVARAHNLLRSFARALPRLTRLFTFAALMKPNERRDFLTQAFEALPRVDLSRELLRATRGSGQHQTATACDIATRAPDHSRLR